MKRKIWTILIIVVAVLALADGYRRFYGGTKQLPEKDHPPLLPAETGGAVAPVKIVPIREGTIKAHIQVYGKIVPAPGATQTVSVPFESRVRRVTVSTGQEVMKGGELLEIEPSPDTRLKFEQASNAYESAKQDLEHRRQLFHLKLATNKQVLDAAQALSLARSELESLRKRGVDGKRDIRADTGGLIQKVFIQEGAIVPAGAPLVEIISQNRLEARLGVEPENNRQVRSNQTVSLTRVQVPDAEGFTGKVREISRAVNPATLLVDVFVALPPATNLLLGEVVLGKIVIASDRGLIVPRSAVLREGTRNIVFTVKNDHAVKHGVKIGIENQKEIRVTGTELQPGDAVVVSGNYELADGMAVRIEVSP